MSRVPAATALLAFGASATPPGIVQSIERTRARIDSLDGIADFFAGLMSGKSDLSVFFKEVPC